MAYRNKKRGSKRSYSRNYSRGGSGGYKSRVRGRNSSGGGNRRQTVHLVIQQAPQQVAYPGMALPGSAAVSQDGLLLAQPSGPPRKSRF